jgi:SPP1 gp7 family putative phage head morphogenesis protein
LFLNVAEKSLNVKNSFDALTNTAFWEQYTMNIFQFSAAKNLYQMQIMRDMVYDENRKLKSFSQFQKDANEFLNVSNQTHLRVEYELASNGAIMADQWNRMYADRDINPYFVYVTRNDDRVRPEHADLNGKVFSFDSPAGQDIYPPNGWNCRCTIEPTNNNKGLLSESQAKSLLEKEVNNDFRYNVGRDGIFPSKKYSYGETLESVNRLNYFNFSSNIELKTINTVLYSKIQENILLNEWMQTAGSKHTDILFRNNEYKFNIFLSPETFNKLNKRGIENISHTIANPSEIWGTWIDENKQKDTKLIFLKTGKEKSYFVEVRDSKITDYGIVKYINRFRNGIKFLK